MKDSGVCDWYSASDVKSPTAGGERIVVGSIAVGKVYSPWKFGFWRELCWWKMCLVEEQGVSRDVGLIESEPSTRPALSIRRTLRPGQHRHRSSKPGSVNNTPFTVQYVSSGIPLSAITKVRFPSSPWRHVQYPCVPELCHSSITTIANDD